MHVPETEVKQWYSFFYLFSVYLFSISPMKKHTVLADDDIDLTVNQLKHVINPNLLTNDLATLRHGAVNEDVGDIGSDLDPHE